MAINLLPNASTRYFANTGAPLVNPSAPRLGSPSGPLYTGAPLAPSLTPGYSRPGAAPSTNPSDQYSLLRRTKNPAIESANNALLGQVGGVNSANQGDLASYTQKLLGGQPANDAALSQEQSSIGDVYNGNLAKQLADARAAYGTAATRATANAVAAGQAARKSEAIGSGYGGSSYFGRQAMAMQNDASAKLAADLADRQSNDIRYVRDAQGRLVGMRNRLSTENAANLLLPTQARSGLLRDTITNTGAVGQLDNQNNIYGVTDNNPYQMFNPNQYPVGSGAVVPLGSNNGGSFLTRTGTGGYQPRSANISALLAEFAQRFGQPGVPNSGPTATLTAPTHDYWNDPNYSLTPNGWVPNNPPPVSPVSRNQEFIDQIPDESQPNYEDPYTYDNAGMIER